MKKIGLAFVALIVILGVYYMTVGSEQVVDEIKKGVNREVVKLKSSGFAIEKREIKTDKEHLIIDFNNTNEITKYINSKSKDISKEDIELLKGLKVGLDIEYNPTVKNAMALDIYPIKLPDIFYSNLNERDKELVKTIEEMMKEKAILVHININKLASGFDGYIKDINRDLKLKGFKFNGDIKDDNIKNLNQTLNEISYAFSKELKIEILNLKTFMTNPMNKNYNNRSEYSLKSFYLNSDNNLTLIFRDIKGTSKDTKVDKLVNSFSKANIASIDYAVDGNKVIFKNINVDMKIDNINIDAIMKLNKISSKNRDDKDLFKKMIPSIKEIIASNISIDISNISIAQITKDNKSFEGFSLKASAKIDKDFDLKEIDNTGPLSMTNVFSTKVNIEASNELVALISSNPRAMVMMMILQPIDKNGKKHYDIEFSKGSLKINGKPLI